MLLGEIPGLALDRTGVALLGALVLVASERVTPAAAWAAVDVPTLTLLFGLMVVSAQLRLGGFYTWVTRRIVSAPLGPPALLAAVVAASGHAAAPARPPPARRAALALSSTLAGNLLVVGSIANIIVVDQAAALGVRIGWRDHARVGVPVTIATLLVAAAWLAG
jgi:Na+/H+ antiporter NhaD/arsenite permease-like protein